MDPREALLREVFQAVTEGRARDVAPLVDPQMEFISVVAGRVFVGVNGLDEWYADVNVYYEDTSWDILEYESLRACDVIRWRFRGRARESQIEFDTEMSQLWSYRNGIVARVEVFPDAEGARLAAGRPAPP